MVEPFQTNRRPDPPQVPLHCNWSNTRLVPDGAHFTVPAGVGVSSVYPEPSMLKVTMPLSVSSDAATRPVGTPEIYAVSWTLLTVPPMSTRPMPVTVTVDPETDAGPLSNEYVTVSVRALPARSMATDLSLTVPLGYAAVSAGMARIPAPCPGAIVNAAVSTYPKSGTLTTSRA